MIYYVSASAVGYDVRAMACETCDRLLADYRSSVHLFSDEVLRMLGALGSDSRLGTQRLSQACQYALDAIMEHRRLEYNGGFPSNQARRKRS